MGSIRCSYIPVSIFWVQRKRKGINLGCTFTWPAKRFNRLQEVKRCRLLLWRCYFPCYDWQWDVNKDRALAYVHDKPGHDKSGGCIICTVTLAPRRPQVPQMVSIKYFFEITTYSQVSFGITWPPRFALHSSSTCPTWSGNLSFWRVANAIPYLTALMKGFFLSFPSFLVK